MPTAVGSVTEAEKQFIETWENVATSTNYVLKLDFRGDYKPSMVQGPRQFKLTTYERILTQDNVIDVRHDPFRNGCFRPVIVPEGVDVETNPNALSDDDILRIFNSSENAWGSYMEVIDSPATLQRMVDLAEQSDTLTVKRLREIQTAAAEHSNIGKKVAGQKDEALYAQIDPGAAAKRGPGRPPKAMTV